MKKRRYPEKPCRPNVPAPWKRYHRTPYSRAKFGAALRGGMVGSITSVSIYERDQGRRDVPVIR